MSARLLAQLALTGGLLAWALSRLRDSKLFERELSPGWLLLGVLCTAPPFVAAALRWCLTARRLGIELPFSRALPEVYAAALLNSVLPTGVAGDALRVARHGAELAGSAPDRPSYRRALQAVVFERVSGQLVLWSVLLLGLALWPRLPLRTPASGALALIALGALWVRRFGLGPRLPAMLRDAYTALIADGAWRAQLITSSVVLLGCSASFACSACALGVPASGPILLRVVPPMLVASALPISVGGFGVRELTNAALYAAAGLDPDAGIAVATLYGGLSLIGSLPGALCLWRQRAAG